MDDGRPTIAHRLSFIVYRPSSNTVYAMTRVAVVTGGTKNIGLAIARRLADADYALVLNYRGDEDAAAAARRELARRTSVKLVRADVGTADGVEVVIDAARETYGRLDVLVNNVGPFLAKPLTDTTDDEWQHLVDGVLSSAFYAMREAIPLMRAEGGGVIVNVGSLNAQKARGAPSTPAYNALKTALVVLTRSVARSEGPNGIRANVVNPGMVDTAGVGEEIVEKIPLRRLGTPEDVAAAVAWLCSDDASYVSGAVLDVHGALWT